MNATTMLYLSVSWRRLRGLCAAVPLGLTLFAASPGAARAETRAHASRSDLVITGGTAHACAIFDDSLVRCWGSNAYGQLGDGTRTDYTYPSPVAGLTDVVELAAGDSHTCALIADGTIKCWGDNSQGQLGRGSFQPSMVPVAVSTIGNGTAMPAIAIAAGGMHTCAVLADGTVTCWGDNDQYQLGDGTAVDRNAPPALPIAGISDAAAVTAGADHTCALRNNGEVMCWGRNANGQVGDGTTTARSTPTAASGIDLADDELAIQISAGRLHTCALTLLANSGGARRARVKCWGFNGSGQLGTGTTADSATPVVAVIDQARSIASSGDHSCVILSDGSVRCWGDNADAQVGDGTIGAMVSGVYQDGIKTTPTAVDNPASAHVLSLGYSHSCRLVSGDLVECWGSNLRGQISQGFFAPGLSEPRLSPDSSVGGVTQLQIVAGELHTCALVTDGEVECWGRNDEGQLGDGTTTSSRTAVGVVGLDDAVALCVGEHHSCAVIADGTVQCWGDNAAGQLGDPYFGSSSTSPVTIVGVDSVVAIACGHDHTCALSVFGAVRCWGENGMGELGNGTTTSSEGVSEVVTSESDTLGRVRSISSDGAHTCTVDAAGVIACWGDNSHGELGDGTTTQRSNPEPITLGHGLTARSTGAGVHHTCAVASDGTAQCWGENSSGELGDGTGVASSTPVDVASLTGINLVTSIDGGALSSCALVADGSLQCWGDNTYGQLGTGTNTSSLSPVAVSGLSQGALASVGGSHACAIRGDGTGWCWGADGSGQLGDSSALADSNVPVTIVSFP